MSYSGAMLLPVELVDEIVENLKDDKQALKVCSLLSTQWLRCARPRLFQKAHFHTNSDIRRWTSFIKRCPDIGSKYLRSIEYNPNALDGTDELKVFPDLGPLPKVTSLSLTSLESPVSIQSLEAFIRSLPSVQKLDLGLFRPTSFLEMARILSLFQGLKSLTAPRAEIEPLLSSIFVPTPDMTFDVSKLEELALGGTAIQSLTAWFLRPVAQIRLRSLDLTLKASVSPSVTLINAVSDTLEELKIRTLSDRLYDTLMALADAVNMPPITRSLPKLCHILFVAHDYFLQVARPAYLEIYLRPAKEILTRLPVTPSVVTFHVMIIRSEPEINYSEDARRNILSTWELKDRFPNLDDLQVLVVDTCYRLENSSRGLELETTEG